MEKLAIELHIWIAAPRERVWNAITEPQHLSQWFFPETIWEIPVLEVGAPVYWHCCEDHMDLHVVESLETLHQFALRWIPHPPETGRTTTFLLEEVDGGTSVTILESGFELLSESWQEQRMYSADESHSEALENLKAYLECSLPGFERIPSYDYIACC